MNDSPAPDLSRLRIERDMLARPRRRRRWIWLAIALLIAAGIGTWALRPHPAAVQTVAVVITYPSQQYVLLNATGYVVPQRKAAIASKATGRLEWLGVLEGSRVKAGEVIARIDNRDVLAQSQSAAANVNATRARLAQAEADARDAARQLRRDQELFDKGFVSIAALDTSKARAERTAAAVADARATITAAEASARNAQVAVDYTLIRAPFDGIILSKSANVGDMITPFSTAAESKGAVVTMADMASLEVEADVSESNLGKVHAGQPCEITLDALPEVRFRGRIGRIVPTVDRAKATVTAKVQFDRIDPRVLPDMSAKVAFLSRDITAAEQQPVVAVNAAAIVKRNDRSVVYAVRDEHAIEVPVQAGERIGDLVAITGDVKAGERVVLKPATDLANAALVKPAAK